MKQKVPLLPNMITAFGVTCGLFVIFMTNMVDPGEGTYGGLLTVSGLLLLAALADVLDGAVARALKAESVFGGLFDSLADAISFGVAPSVIAMKALSVDPGTELSFFVTAGGIIFSLCGVLRLVRFGVMAGEAKASPALTAANMGSFTGLPIPAAAAAAVSLCLFLHSPDYMPLVGVDPAYRAVLIAAAMMGLGYLMVSRWKFPSVKTLHMKVASFQIVFYLVTIAVLLLYGVVNHFPITFLMFAWGYILVGASLSLVRAIVGRRMKGLEDFAPDDEEE